MSSPTESAPSTNSSSPDDRVVLKQTLCSFSEVFLYKIPPLATTGGRRAEDWNLAEPLHTCSMTVERQDNTCVLRLLAPQPKPGGPPGATQQSLYCQCIIDLADSQHKLQYYCEAVVDSSRYFCIRISATGKSALIGLGFRERDDASNFRLALQDYEQSLQRERKAMEMHQHAEEQEEVDEVNDSLPVPMSTLTLKEGEKIHIELKGHETKSYAHKPRVTSPNTTKGGGVPLLKKPPPPAAATAVADTVTSTKLNMDAVQTPAKKHMDDEYGSVDAVQDETENDNDDDDWDDFQSPAASSTTNSMVRE